MAVGFLTHTMCKKSVAQIIYLGPLPSDGFFDVSGTCSGKLICESNQNGHSESDIELLHTLPSAAQCTYLAVLLTVHGEHTMIMAMQLIMLSCC